MSPLLLARACRQGLHGLLAAVLLAAAASAVAQPAQGEGMPWSRLTPAQRAALAPLADEWGGIEASRQQKWLEIATRFPRMSQEERSRMQQRMNEWAKLSPRERGQARVNFQEARQLSPAAERQARWESYQALPEEQKRKLADRAQPGAGDRGSKAAANSGQAAKKPGAARAPSAPVQPRPVAPTVVQTGPGATTTLVSRPPPPAPRQQAARPKITSTPSSVDAATLLPKRPKGEGQPASAPEKP
ncbi:DUF3106 domain-containing protein [Aquincola sp. MAHUQ-54]|uniref:DUF3106 domain-containing protein n=1 Tax=Aquincola agrisoli TaxID=3119538 RepID=A0AAW9QGB6_9BURK